MGVKFENNAFGTLFGDISIDQTYITLQSSEGDKFPVIISPDYCYVTVVNVSGDREIMKVTARAALSDVLTVERGADDSSASAYSDNDKVSLRLPKIVLEEFETDIAANVSGVATNVSDIAALDARVAVNETDLAGTTNAGSVPAPAGTIMWFAQPAAPSQWTISEAAADRLLAIKGGTAAYNVAGGQLASDWIPTGHVHEVPEHLHGQGSHKHTLSSHTHTSDSHNHSSGSLAASASGSATQYADFGGDIHVVYNTHTHGITGSTGNTTPDPTGGPSVTDTSDVDPGNTDNKAAFNTESGSEPSVDRPAAVVGILAIKD